VDHATHPFGLATPSGFISTTGVGGLTLGGGIGYLSRTLGLTIDILLGVDMVLADGSFVTATSLHNLDTLYHKQGKYEQAEPLVARALAISEQQLGLLHPDTQIIRGNYSAILSAIGRDEEAAVLETKHMPPS
jgi:hypothetical protein